MRIYFSILLLMHSFLLLAKKKDKNTKIIYKPLTINLSYQTGNFFSYGKGDIEIKTKFGQGAALTLQYRITKKIAYNLGFHVSSFALDKEKFQQSFLKYYTVPDYYTSVFHYFNNQYNLTLWGFSPSISYIYQKNKIMIEPFLKINTSFFNYSIDSRAYLHLKDSNSFNIYNVKGHQNIFALMPSVGAKFQYKISKLLSVNAAIEIGSTIGNQYLSENSINILQEKEKQALYITTPKLFSLISVGFCFRPFNSIKNTESQFDNEKYLKKFEKNE